MTARAPAPTLVVKRSTFVLLTELPVQKPLRTNAKFTASVLDGVIVQESTAGLKMQGKT